MDELDEELRAVERELEGLRQRSSELQVLEAARRDVQALRLEEERLAAEAERVEAALEDGKERLARAQAALKQQAGPVPQPIVAVLTPNERGETWRRRIRWSYVFGLWMAFAIVCTLGCVLLDWLRVAG